MLLIWAHFGANFNIWDKLGQVFEKLVDQEIDLKGPEGSKNGTFRPNCFSS